jgi:hypothetical protein
MLKDDHHEKSNRRKWAKYMFVHEGLRIVKDVLTNTEVKAVCKINSKLT